MPCQYSSSAKYADRSLPNKRKHNKLVMVSILTENENYTSMCGRSWTHKNVLKAIILLQITYPDSRAKHTGRLSLPIKTATMTYKLAWRKHVVCVYHICTCHTLTVFHKNQIKWSYCLLRSRFKWKKKLKCKATIVVSNISIQQKYWKCKHLIQNTQFNFPSASHNNS